MVCKRFDKKFRDATTYIETGSFSQDQQLANELQKLIIRKFKKRKIYSSFRDNLCVTDLAYMLLISKYSKGVRILVIIIDIYSIYAWVLLLKDKKGISLTNILQKEMDKFGRKPNKI